MINEIVHTYNLFGNWLKLVKGKNCHWMSFQFDLQRYLRFLRVAPRGSLALGSYSVLSNFHLSYVPGIHVYQYLKLLFHQVLDDSLGSLHHRSSLCTSSGNGPLSLISLVILWGVFPKIRNILQNLLENGLHLGCLFLVPISNLNTISSAIKEVFWQQTHGMAFHFNGSASAPRCGGTQIGVSFGLLVSTSKSPCAHAGLNMSSQSMRVFWQVVFVLGMGT